MTSNSGDYWICKQTGRKGYYCGANNPARNNECYICNSYKSKSIKSAGSGREGDWQCPKCNGLVFASKTHCRKCNIAKPTTAASTVARANVQDVPSCRPGDWRCPKCAELVFSTKTHCRKCGTANPSGTVNIPSQSNPLAATLPQSGKPSMEPGDWYCNSCKSPTFNFKTRTVCFNCPASRDLNESHASSSSSSAPVAAPLVAPSVQIDGAPSSNEADMCVICWEREAVMVVLACRQKSMCEVCCYKESSCPSCRVPYDPFDKSSLLRIYNSGVCLAEK